MFFKALIALKETFSLDTYRNILTHVKEYFMDSEICITDTKIFLLALYATIDQISNKVLQLDVKHSHTHFTTFGI